MEFFQEPTFNAFLALVLTVLVAKLVSFAVNNSSAGGGGDSVVNGGAVAKKDVILDRGLRVRSTRGKKRVKFVDEVVIKRVDYYEGSENLVLLDGVDEKGLENVDQFGESEDSGGEMTKKQCFDVREMDDGEAQSEKMEMLIEKGCDGDDMDGDFGGQEKNSDKGSENVEMLIEKECDGDDVDDGVFNEKEKTLGTDVEEQKNGVELESDDVKIDQKEGNGLVGSGENEGLIAGDMVDESVDDEDDDWEGIERSELEKVFAEAVNYLEYGGKGKDRNDDDRLAKLSSDVQMQLYGLHKVAVEGPCNEPQPMALKVSARAKWNAWQRLGSVGREAAMEQYIRVLSDSIPEWMHDYADVDDIQGSPTPETAGKIEYDRKPELSATPVGDSNTGQSSLKEGKYASITSFQLLLRASHVRELLLGPI
ncbi:Acyl-CoA-binding domain-containing protein 3 [Sesamum alatum]|uniref:Acyl-CoA-binding domain-containing protein 3 n=1 Tax=Sesamum alatum TaxID=300844 RepID=A0AAE2CU97_9LAMI|nr:Acyl-CoA-binding domain-containing protein 3 [Sesamum alatum]